MVGPEATETNSFPLRQSNGALNLNLAGDVTNTEEFILILGIVLSVQIVASYDGKVKLLGSINIAALATMSSSVMTP